MNEVGISRQPKKFFFKLPDDVSAMKDDEIDALAEAIWSNFVNGQDQPQSD